MKRRRRNELCREPSPVLRRRVSARLGGERRPAGEARGLGHADPGGAGRCSLRPRSASGAENRDGCDLHDGPFPGAVGQRAPLRHSGAAGLRHLRPRPACLRGGRRPGAQAGYRARQAEPLLRDGRSGAGCASGPALYERPLYGLRFHRDLHDCRLRHSDDPPARAHDPCGGPLYDLLADRLRPVHAGDCLPLFADRPPADAESQDCRGCPVGERGIPHAADDRHVPDDPRPLHQERSLSLPLLDAGYLRLFHALLGGHSLRPGDEGLYLPAHQDHPLRLRRGGLLRERDPVRALRSGRRRDGGGLDLCHPGERRLPHDRLLLRRADRLYLHGRRPVAGARHRGGSVPYPDPRDHQARSVPVRLPPVGGLGRTEALQGPAGRGAPKPDGRRGLCRGQSEHDRRAADDGLYRQISVRLRGLPRKPPAGPDASGPGDLHRAQYLLLRAHPDPRL